MGNGFELELQKGSHKISDVSRLDLELLVLILTPSTHTQESN